jgi:hypothetical protein
MQGQKWPYTSCARHSDYFMPALDSEGIADMGLNSARGNSFYIRIFTISGTMVCEV